VGVPLFKVKKIGLQSSFQDLGRRGFLKYGVVQGGAMDQYSLQISNLLVGNKRDEACIEICMIGPELECLASSTIAICGGSLNPTLNGEKLPIWKSVRVKKGDVICFGKPDSGLRSYIAVQGGFHVPEVMGSKSYYDKAKIGTPIEKHSIIFGHENPIKSKLVGLSHTEIPIYSTENSIRFIPGLHNDHFTSEGIQHFLDNKYVITSRADRMGIQLQGDNTITHKNGADILSDAMPFGGIQVPASGQPIIMMADRQTTGGYTRIGTVTSVDLPKLAQTKPGDIVQFIKVSIEEAQGLLRKQEKYLRRLEQTIKARYI
jgi:antagonist of KipI